MKQFLSTLVAVVLFFSATAVSAATLSFSAPEASTRTRFAIDVVIDTEMQDINSADITVRVPEPFIYEGYEEGVLSTWLVRPEEKNKGVIHFLGIIPGGVGRSYDPFAPETKGVSLVRLLFSSAPGIHGTVTAENVHVYAHDGQATELEVRVTPLTMRIGEEVTEKFTEEAIAPFSITLIKASDLSNGRMLAVFEAKGGTGGIARYEARYFGRVVPSIESPYQVSRVTLPHTLTIRAYDRVGNYQDATVWVPGSAQGIMLIVGLAVFAILFLCIHLVRRKKQLSVPKR